MKLFSTLATAATTLAYFTSVADAATFNKDGKNLVLYWGQNSGGSQQTLGEYCDQSPGSIYVISFLNNFGGSQDPEMTLANCNGGLCTDIGKDIKKCQQAGKKVMLSLGGSIGEYGLANEKEGEKLADQLWNIYGGGNSSAERPFDDAVVDGFDLDIEKHGQNQNAYIALAKRLKQHSNDLFLSAAPQCVYPDQNVGKILESGELDFALVQFYNNPCAVDQSFNFDKWESFAKKNNLKVYLGLPGSKSAAGSGYVEPAEVSKAVDKVRAHSEFAGIMLWDASQAFTNMVDDDVSTKAKRAGGKITYAKAMQDILDKPVPSAVPTPVDPTASTLRHKHTKAPGTTDGGKQTIPADNVSGSCSGKKGAELANCINSNSGNGPINTGNGAGSSYNSTCAAGQVICNGSQFSKCSGGKWANFRCTEGTECKAKASGDDVVVGCSYIGDVCPR